MSNKIIRLDELPNEVLEKIPFSLRVRQNIYEFDELPLEIQYIIDKYHETKVPEIEYDITYDFVFEISEYSDFKSIKNRKQLIVWYLKNYLITRLSSYPYDVEFGCALKDQLQTKDTSLRQTLISNELILVCGVLGADYNMNINIVNITLEKSGTGTAIEYNATIKVKIGDENFTINV
jgi:hypothetical protein